MTDWTRKEITTRKVVFSIKAAEPWGACWNQVQQALDAARHEWQNTHGISDELYDDSIRVHVADDRIDIEFEVTE